MTAAQNIRLPVVSTDPAMKHELEVIIETVNNALTKTGTSTPDKTHWTWKLRAFYQKMQAEKDAVHSTWQKMKSDQARHQKKQRVCRTFHEHRFHDHGLFQVEDVDNKLREAHVYTHKQHGFAVLWFPHSQEYGKSQNEFICYVLIVTLLLRGDGRPLQFLQWNTEGRRQKQNSLCVTD